MNETKINPQRLADFHLSSKLEHDLESQSHFKERKFENTVFQATLSDHKITASNTSFINCQFNISDSVLDFKDCTLQRVNLDGLTGLRLNLTKSTLTGSSLKASEILNSHLEECKIDDCDMSFSSWEGTKLRSVVFSPLVLCYNTQFTGVDFQHCTLPDAFLHAEFLTCTFSECTLSNELQQKLRNLGGSTLLTMAEQAVTSKPAPTPMVAEQKSSIEIKTPKLPAKSRLSMLDCDEQQKV